MAEPVPTPTPGMPLFYGQPGDPVVVVLHDWYGRLPAVEAYAEALAARGLRVAVPDLYEGALALDDEMAESLMDGLDIGAALASIDDAMVEAQETGVERVGLVGFSLGGWLGLLHAQAGAVDAVVAYYASLDSKDHGVVPCPVLLHWAEEDEWGEGDDPDAFVGRLKDHGTPVSEHRYLSTGHSFANASIPAKVNAQAAALAFARTAAFLEQCLKD